MKLTKVQSMLPDYGINHIPERTLHPEPRDSAQLAAAMIRNGYFVPSAAFAHFDMKLTFTIPRQMRDAWSAFER
jgi:hypothetical protein